MVFLKSYNIHDFHDNLVTIHETHLRYSSFSQNHQSVHDTFNTLSNENLLNGIMVGIEKLTGTKLHFYTALHIKLTQLEITLPSTYIFHGSKSHFCF